MTRFNNLLFKDSIEINKNIKILIPSLEEILNDEENYYNLVYMITAMPIDMMVQLDDWGIDFSTINQFELFILLFNGLKTMDTSLIFGDLDLSKFELAVKEDDETVVLIDKDNEIVIDKLTHFEICEALRKVHRLKKDDRKPGNDEARKYLIQRARIKAKRNKNKPHASQLEPLIVAMVNAEQFKYDFNTVKNLSIYQFNESVDQIINKVNFDNRMYGVYTGSISTKDLKPDDMSWIRLDKA